MTRSRVDPMNIGDPMTLQPDGDKPARHILMQEPESGAATRVSVQSLGWPGTMGRPGFFESHSCDEEVYMIRGSLNFQGLYTLVPGDYANHPPHWVHPSGQVASPDEPTVFLIKHSGPVDFFWDEIPQPWDGQEFYARPFDGPRGAGTTKLATGGLPWQGITVNGRQTDITCKILWHNPRDGWTTWMERVEPGWRGKGEPRTQHGSGDEMFVLSGDMTTVRDGQRVTLTAGSYYCYPDVRYAGGQQASSESGMLCLRWTKFPPEYELPLPAVR